MLAATYDVWDMQFLCLQMGADVRKSSRACETHGSTEWTAWQMMLERLQRRLQAPGGTSPLDGIVRT
jgi:hypothetical protein